MFEYVVTATASAISAAMRMLRSFLFIPLDVGVASDEVAGSLSSAEARGTSPPPATAAVAPARAARLKNNRLDTPDGLSSVGPTGSFFWVVFMNISSRISGKSTVSQIVGLLRP